MKTFMVQVGSAQFAIYLREAPMIGDWLMGTKFGAELRVVKRTWLTNGELLITATLERDE